MTNPETSIGVFLLTPECVVASMFFLMEEPGSWRLNWLSKSVLIGILFRI